MPVPCLERAAWLFTSTSQNKSIDYPPPPSRPLLVSALSLEKHGNVYLQIFQRITANQRLVVPRDYRLAGVMQRLSQEVASRRPVDGENQDEQAQSDFERAVAKFLEFYVSEALAGWFTVF